MPYQRLTKVDRSDHQASLPNHNWLPTVARKSTRSSFDDKASSKPNQSGTLEQAPLPSSRSNSGYNFGLIKVHADSVTDALQRAANEPSALLDARVRRAIEQNLGHDLGEVRVHRGAASATAAERLGARAYTLGRDIHLGAEAHRLSGIESARLLAHEAVHTVQQGGERVAPQAKMNVSSPADASEVEAERIAGSIVPSTGTLSHSLAQHQHFRPMHVAPHEVSRFVSPMIQRDDLKGDYTVKSGSTFNLDFVQAFDVGNRLGLRGKMTFRAGAEAPDSTKIRLLQVARNRDLATLGVTKKEGASADINQMMTSENIEGSVEAGAFVDHLPTTINPRTRASDPAVEPYYALPFNPPVSKDGSKTGTTVEEAWLTDHPASKENSRRSFETAAVAADTGHLYGAVRWNFDVNATAARVERVAAAGYDDTSPTFKEAIKLFNEFYRNPNTPNAPPPEETPAPK